MSFDNDFVLWVSHQISALLGSTEDQFRELLNMDSEASSRLAGFCAHATPSRLFFFFKQGIQPQELREQTCPPSRESTATGAEKKAPHTELLCMTCDDGLVQSKGKLVCIYRSKEDPIGPRFEDSVHLVEFSKNKIQNAQIALHEVFLPVMPLDCSVWGDCTDDERQILLKTMRNIAGSLSEASRSIKGGLELHRMDYKQEDTTKSKSDENAVKADYIVACERLVEVWIEQIEDVLQDASRNDEEDSGPDVEMTFWRRRSQNLQLISEQLKSKELRNILVNLNYSKGKLVKRWKVLDAKLTDALNEAKDNVKYLSVIEQFTEPLYSGSSWQQINDCIPNIMNNIKIMIQISRSYNTGDKVTILLMKICNQIIKAATRIVSAPGLIWVQPHDELQTNLECGAKTCDLFRDQYKILVSKVAHQGKGKSPEINEASVFARLDVLCRRLRKLQSLFTTIDQFSQFSRQNVDGMLEIVQSFQNLTTIFKEKKYNLLDLAKTTFDRDFIDFNAAVAELEGDIQFFIDQSFEGVTSAEHALQMLQTFESIIQRDSLKSDLESKYAIIFHKYGLDLAQVQQIYESQKASPPFPRNIPPVAGNIMWSQMLLRRIEEPMVMFKDNPLIQNNIEARDIIRTYNRVARALIQFEHLWHEAWLKAVDNAKTGLLATLLVESPFENKLYVNFDPEIMQLIRESKTLQRMKIPIPESASIILQQEDKFKYYYYQLSFAVDEYGRVCEKVAAVTKAILAPHLDDLLQIFGPGLHILTWQSMNIDAYLSRLHNSLRKFEELVDKINEIIDNRISTNVKKISRMIFVTLPADASFTLEQFVSLQDKSIRAKSEELITKNKLVERAVQDIIPLLSRYQFEGAPPLIDKDDIDNFIDHFADKMYVAILNATKNSFIALKKRLGSRVTGGFLFVERPFFDVDVELSVPNVTMSPSLEEIQTAINQCALLVIWCLKDVYLWTDSSHQKQHSQKKSFYEEVAKDKVLVKVVLLLTGSIDGSKRQVLEYLQAFRKYDYLWKDDKAHAFTNFLRSQPTLSNFEEQIRQYFTIEKEISDIAPVHNIGCMSLETASLKNSLKAEASAWKSIFGKSLHSRARDLLLELQQIMDQFEKKLSIKVFSFETLKTAWMNIKEMRDKDHEIEVMINPVEDHFEVLRKFAVRVPSEEEDAVLFLRKKWVKVGKMCISLQQDLSMVQTSLKNELQLSIKHFHGTCREFRSEYENTGPCNPHMPQAEAIVCLKRFQLKTEMHLDTITELNMGERIFNLVPTNFPEIHAVAKSLELIRILHHYHHNTLQMLATFSETVWSDVVQNCPIIMNKLAEADQNRSLIAPALKSWPAYLEVSHELSTYINASCILPLISSRAIRSRHWILLAALSQDFGIPFQMQQENVILRSVLSLGLHLNKIEVQNIHDNAVEELNVEKQLNDIIEEWNDEHLKFAEHKGDKKILLQSAQVSDLLLRLEDSQTNLQKLAMSIHSLPFKEDLECWISKLSNVHDILEKWLAAQSLWLEAAFCMNDVAKKLPTEAKRFHAVDKNYLKTMKKACEVTSVIQCCGSDWVQNFLPVVMSQLQLVFKSMSNYLDQKRNAFPRFYFVSDHCILDLMANSRDSDLLQYNMHLVFPGCRKMLLEELPNCLSIVGLVTSGGETVHFGTSIMVTGQLEDWLNRTVVEMQESLKGAFANAVDESVSSSASDFVNQVNMQVGVVALQYIWTRDVQDAIQKTKMDKLALAAASKKVTSTFQSFTRLRQLRQISWSSSQLKSLELFITTQSYLKDAIEEIIRKKVSQIGDFDWQRSARMYWNDEDRNCKASIGCKDFRYNYEYLKAEGRLFVFPNTERAHYRMIQTLASFNGTLLMGRAETGKTETIKSLACFLGKMVQCIDCALNLDFQMISKSNIGTASHGSWSCYKNIDSMSQSILSLFVQNIQCVLSALRERKDQIMFTEGELVQVDPRCGFFVMSSKMSSNFRMTTYFKNCFRTYCLCEPDLDAIVKLKLTSIGAEEAGSLGKKIGLIFKSIKDIFGQTYGQSFGLRSLLAMLKKFEFQMNTGILSEVASLHASILQVYAPKFAQNQLPIFESLLEDILGPVPEQHDMNMEEFIIQNLADKYRIKSNAELIQKICYMIDALQTSNNTMVVGETGVGKTLSFDVALAYIRTLNSETKHAVHRIYPNAISQDWLFGGTESKDHGNPGILFSILKKGSSARFAKTCQWIVMDGPAQGLWMDMVHIYLDKNKFQTGDFDNHNRSLQLVVETDSIKCASPSSVSHFNLVHTCETSISHLSIFDTWIMNNGPSYVMDSLANLSKSYFKLLHGIIVRECNSMLNVCIWSQMTAMTCLMQTFVEAAKASNFIFDSQSIDRLYLFCFAWGFGTNLDDCGRAIIHSTLVTHARLSLPSDGTIFDYLLDATTFAFNPCQKYVAEWNAGLPKQFDNSTNLIMSTPDFVRYQSLCSLFLKSGKSTLFIGQQRCGKTTLLDHFKQKLASQNYQVKSMFFESHQTASVVQSLITKSLVRKPGKLLSPAGEQVCVYFVDDLYCIREPANQQNEEESPSELFRQLLGDGGFWATDASVNSEWTAVKNVRFAGAAPFPTSSDAKISTRKTRHFQIIYMTELNADALISVFSSSLADHFSTSKHARADVLMLVPGLMMRTIALLDHLQITEFNGKSGGVSNAKVTGKKNNYVGTIANVVRGIQMCDPQDVTSWVYLLELWKSECMRVITDEMSSQRDVAVVEKAILMNANAMNNPDLYKGPQASSAKALKKKDAASELKYNDKAIARFGTICSPAKKYEMIKSSGKMLSQIEEDISAYHEKNYDDPLQFMIFDFAVDHLLRVCRSMAHQNKPIALVGKVYTGRKSLVKLASYILGHKTVQFDGSHERNVESWKQAFKEAGIENSKVTGLINEICLENAKLASQISNFMRMTEIPELFTKEESNSIIADLRGTFKRQHPTSEDVVSNIWSFFLGRVKCNLHLVFFLDRAHDDDAGQYDVTYPGIFSAISRIFVREWPSVALKSIASKILGPVKLTVDDETKLRLIICFAGIHAEISACTGEYEALKGQRIEITSSKTYMSFVNYFLSIFEKNISRMTIKQVQIQKTLACLSETEQRANSLATEMETRDESLGQIQINISDILTQIGRLTAIAEKNKQQLQSATQNYDDTLKDLEADRKHCDEGLVSAAPILEEAERSLLSLTPKDFIALKTFKNPPSVIKLIFDTVLLLFHSPIHKVEIIERDGKKSFQDSWANAFALLKRENFVDSLRHFNKEAINPETIELMQPYIEHEDFLYSKARKASAVAAGVFGWVHAMLSYFSAASNVRSKIDHLQAATAKFEVMQKRQATLKFALEDSQAYLTALQKEFEEVTAKRAQIILQSSLTKQRLDNAHKLIETLTVIRASWQTASSVFEAASSRLVGDALVAAATLNYCGPFNQEYRSFLLRDKVYRNLEVNNIPFSNDFSLAALMLNHNDVDRWHAEGLTHDDLATENAIILSCSTKYAFVIDPEEQFFQWITCQKQISRDRVHVVHSPSSKDLPRIFENCVTTGQKLLLQDPHSDETAMVLVQSLLNRTSEKLPIRVCDKMIHVDNNFVMYCQTTDHFCHKALKPALYSDMTVINFSISLESFETQMLHVILSKERPDCSESIKSLRLQMKTSDGSMQEIEFDTLKLLSESHGNIIENDSLLEALLNNQAKSNSNQQRKKSMTEQLMRVGQSAEEYRPVATRAAILFFSVRNMSKVDHMYSTTLNEFLRVYDTNTCFSDAASLTAKRLSLLINASSQTVLIHYTKGYTEAHSNLLAMSVALKYGIVSGLCESVGIQFLVHGGSQLDLESIPKKTKEWIPDNVWKNVVALARVNSSFQRLPELLLSSSDIFWKALFDHEEPEIQDISPLNLSAGSPENEAWMKLLFIRAFREDRALACSKLFVKTVLGSSFKDMIADSCDLETLIDSPLSSWSVPNICIFQISGHHSTNDFITQISVLSKRRRIDVKIVALASESESTIRLLPKLISSKMWLVLQNAHLCVPVLAEIYNLLQNCETAHPEFRLWLTTESTSAFPIALLQTSLKFRSKDQDPTIGGTIVQLYNEIGQQMYDSVSLPAWRQTMYSLAFFHSLIVARQKFGFAGWNMQYQFNNSEFHSTLSFAQAMFAEAELRKTKDCINFHALRWVIAVNYGGRIMDSNDTLILKALSDKYVSISPTESSSLFSKQYRQPAWANTDYAQARQHFGGLPAQDKAESFGFYQNAEFGHFIATFQDLALCLKRTVGLEADSVQEFNSQLKVNPTDYRPISRSAFSFESASTIESLRNYCYEFLTMVPARIEKGVLEIRTSAYLKANGGKSHFLFAFFLHELALIENVYRETNVLLERILRCILSSGYKLNAAHDEDSDNQIKRDVSRIYRNVTPETFQRLAFPFVTNMRAWFERLRKAGEQINQFVFRSRPRCFWLGGINSPKGFLTAFRIENAIKKGWTMEETIISVEFSRYDNESQIKDKDIPIEVAYISGCKLEGATWSAKEGRLMELSPRLPQTCCPIISVTAAHSRCISKYSCKTVTPFLFAALLKIDI